MVLLATALAMVSGSALAADMRMPSRPPPPPAFDPWDFAFGARSPATTVPRHRPVQPQAVGLGLLRAALQRQQDSAALRRRRAAPASPSRTAPRPKSTSTAVSARPSACSPSTSVCSATSIRVDSASTAAHSWSGIPGSDSLRAELQLHRRLPVNGNFIKKGAELFEVLRQGQLHHQRQVALGANYYYSPYFLNSAPGATTCRCTVKWTAPELDLRPSGLGMYISGEFGRQFLGTSDSFYGTASPPARRRAVPVRHQVADYNTWNVGIGFTYKVFTLDLRYSGTDLSKGDCNAFTSDSHRELHRSVHPRSTRAASAPTGAARPASSSSRLT